MSKPKGVRNALLTLGAVVATAFCSYYVGSVNGFNRTDEDIENIVNSEIEKLNPESEEPVSRELKHYNISQEIDSCHPPGGHWMIYLPDSDKPESIGNGIMFVIGYLQEQKRRGRTSVPYREACIKADRIFKKCDEGGILLDFKETFDEWVQKLVSYALIKINEEGENKSLSLGENYEKATGSPNCYEGSFRFMPLKPIPHFCPNPFRDRGYRSTPNFGDPRNEPIEI